ncbi:MAG: sulfotransferase [Acidobacteriota bacterium]
MTMVTVIGRGHSGTRIMSHTLNASGVYMGAELNKSGDLIPPDDMYEACRVMARYVSYLGDLRWDFTKLHTMTIDPAFIRLMKSYLASVLNSNAQHKGWKIPETTLVYPWIVRMFPDIHYIHWIRDPRDSILGKHVTDNLADFGIPCDRTDNVYSRRAISWKYQVKIVEATPPPKYFFTVPFEYFVLDQEKTLAELQAFLGFSLVKIEVRPDAVSRWRHCAVSYDFEIFHDDLIKHGYAQQGRIEQMVQKALDMLGPEGLKRRIAHYSWTEQVQQAAKEIAELISEGEILILADGDSWGTDKFIAGRRRIQFIERDGIYWGAPDDDRAAIEELERLRRSGASFIVFGWPVFWWFDFYREFHSYLRSRFPCVLENDRLVAFDLRPAPVVISRIEELA